MDKSELYPLKFKEIYKHYIWGGKNLRKIGKRINNNETVAESWEISDHGEDISTIINGNLRGKTLREIIVHFGEAISPKTDNGRFPILIKYLDSNRRLSVQVHPDDDYARIHESPGELGKTECWYVIEAEKGAELIMGMERGMTKSKFKKLISENRIEEGLNKLPVSKGDFIYIKSGTVHALLEGIIVCEIQENSDTTYRLYDWGRVGHDGKPRPLHIEKALDVINFPSEESYEEYMKTLLLPYTKSKLNITYELVRCKHFNIDLLKYDTDFEVSLGNSHFHTLNILSGKGRIRWTGEDVPFDIGETVLIPRAVNKYSIQTGGTEILKTFL